MKKIWDLNYEDKLLHKHMSFARTQLRKVARLIEQYKQDSNEWQKHAKEAAGAAEYLTTWMEAVRRDEVRNG